MSCEIYAINDPSICRPCKEVSTEQKYVCQPCCRCWTDDNLNADEKADFMKCGEKDVCASEAPGKGKRNWGACDPMMMGGASTNQLPGKALLVLPLLSFSLSLLALCM